MKRQLLLLTTFFFACSSTPSPGTNAAETGDTGSETETGDSESSSEDASTGSESGDGDGDSSENDSGNQPIECEGYNEADYPEEPVTFTVEGERAIMAGYVTSTTPAAVTQLLDEHPEVQLIVMPFVPGSEDDVSNLQAARMIHDAGLDTCVPSTGLIASGGVDFFLAGARRAAGAGAPIGVHSWATGGGIEGGDLPMDHPDHALFLDFYADIGIDAAFYWFTLEAAPADGIHWMTAEELETYGVLTE